MRYARTLEETLTDKAVLLTLLTRISNHSKGTSLGDRLKIQKLTFLFCYRLFQQRIKALNYTFFTYRWGPFTKDMYEAEADFEQAGLIQRDGQQYSLTEIGKKWGNSLYKALDSDADNQDIVKDMDCVISEYGDKTTKHLVAHTHAMYVVPIGWQEEERLDELPYHINLTGALEEEESTALIRIERGLLDSFAMMLNDSNKLTIGIGDSQ
jgi:uncharacterized phage-associated protein